MTQLGLQLEPKPRRKATGTRTAATSRVETWQEQWARVEGLCRGSAFRAAELFSEGGVCDAGGIEAIDRALFRVSLHDGRVFERCRIQGSGGPMIAEPTVGRRASRWLERYGRLRIIVVDRGHAWHWRDFTAAEIARVEVLS